MRTGLLAEKLGMTRLFGDDGSHSPVTVLRVGTARWSRRAGRTRDGYCARAARRRQGQGQERDQADARPLRQGEGRAQGQARRVPGQRGRAARAGHRALGRAFRGRPVRRRLRHQHRQGLRRRDEALGLQGPARHRTASRSRTARTARPASGRIRARCSRARRWPATWAIGGSRCRTSRCSASTASAAWSWSRARCPGAEGGYVRITDAVKRALPKEAPLSRPALRAGGRRRGAGRSRGRGVARHGGRGHDPRPGRGRHDRAEPGGVRPAGAQRRAPPGRALAARQAPPGHAQDQDQRRDQGDHAQDVQAEGHRPGAPRRRHARRSSAAAARRSGPTPRDHAIDLPKKVRRARAQDRAVQQARRGQARGARSGGARRAQDQAAGRPARRARLVVGAADRRRRGRPELRARGAQPGRRCSCCRRRAPTSTTSCGATCWC